MNGYSNYKEYKRQQRKEFIKSIINGLGVFLGLVITMLFIWVFFVVILSI